MGYLHINNLYKSQTILLFKECYALEKIHGTSAHISFNEGKLSFFSGGEKHTTFVALFDQGVLIESFIALNQPKITVFGEAYGGRCQGMKETYGDKLKFIAFDVMINDHWLDVPNAEDVCKKLGIEFVPYARVSTDISALDSQRDLPSRQSIRNGITEPKISEGVVLRPLHEFLFPDGVGRIIAKHKRPEFSERTSKRDTNVSPEKLEVLYKADAIANEWVTSTRLTHVLDKLSANLQRSVEMKDVRVLIDAMIANVLREGKDEIVESKEIIKVISTATVKLFKKTLEKSLVST